MMEKKYSVFDEIPMYSLLVVAYIMGLFVPLMDSDAAHHANIALHMYRNHDFVNLIDGGKDYLDKPHLLFWLSGLFYSLFGVNMLAYKLPSFILSAFAVFATKKLGEKLYDAQVGKLAALILASSQAFILACNDVRMDAILTACIILAVWQLLEVALSGKWYNCVLAALFMAMGFSTKGMVGIVMPGIALFFYLLYRRDLKTLFHIRWLIIGLLLVVFISPVVYSYYLQFDLHPEKIIRGRNKVSGIQFILWGQNTERLEGKNWGGGKKDYFFYLHTMLWAFLPWCILAYYAIGSRIKRLFSTGFSYQSKQEGLTISTILLIFVLISLSHFQLPHYLNILFPFFSILTAAELVRLQYAGKERALKNWLVVQLFVSFILIAIIAFISTWIFPVTNVWIIVLSLLVLSLFIATISQKTSPLVKLTRVSVLSIVLVNILLNGNFYRKLIDYQGGSTLARIANMNKISPEKIVSYNEHSFSFDFDRGRLAAIYSLDDVLRRRDDFWVFTNEEGSDTLKFKGLPLGKIYAVPQYHVTRLTAKFLNPKTRSATLTKFYLIQVNARP